MNKPDSHGGGLDWTKICEKSSKVITFIDLAGHEKYLKTTVFGMTGHLPDFCMLMVREGKAKWVCVVFCCLNGLSTSSSVYLSLLCLILLSGWQQRWHCWHDQGASGSGTGSECACVCSGYKDRHVSSQHPSR